MNLIKIVDYVPIIGEFEKEEDVLIFHGGTNTTGVFNTYNDPKTGLVLFPAMFKDGKIKVKFKFENADYSSSIGIVYDYFPYANSINYQYAGVSNVAGYFSYSVTPTGSLTNFSNGKQNIIKSGQEYLVEIEVMGNYLQLTFNGVTVGNGSIMKLSESNIGLYIQSGGDVQIFNFESNQQKPKVFVVMQFSDEYKAIYEDVIKTICLKRGLDVIRGDESYNNGMIINDIIRKIEESSLIIADITPDNPNVFYEVGYAHALKKPTILMSDSTRLKLPFDVSGFRTIFYDNKIGGKRLVEDTLCKFLDELNLGNRNNIEVDNAK